MRSTSFLILVLMVSLGLNAYLLLGYSIGLPIINTDIASGLDNGKSDARYAESLGNKDKRVSDGRSLENLFRVGDRNNDKALLVSDLNAAFAIGEFDNAIDGWQWLSSNDADLAARIKVAWLNSAEQWLAEGKIQPVMLFTQTWLREYPYDKSLRHLQAQWQLASGKRKHAIETLYALMNELPAIEQGRYIGQISEIVDAEIKQLSDQQAWLPLIRFIERLLWHEPQHPPYILMLAKAHIELQKFSQAKALLYSLQYDEYYGAQAKELLQRIALSDLRATSILLEKQKEHYLVNGVVDNNNTINLMIDTGASISVMSQQYFYRIKNQLAPTFIRNAKINTAGGMVEAPIYQFSSFAIEDYRIADMQFVVMDLESGANNKGDGLLGMNFLKAFNFQIDQQNSRLLLQPR